MLVVRRFSLCVVMLATSAFVRCQAAAPAISSGGVVNGAGYVAGLGIAQGSYFSIFGTDLGPTPGVSANAASASNGYPTTLPGDNGTSVTVTSGGNAFHCFVTFTSALQVNAILPSTVPVGTATLTVTFNGATSAPEPINVAQSQFEAFTENAQGWGQAAAQLVSPEPFLTNNLTTPAVPTHFIAVYGTGLGKLPGTLADNKPTGSTLVNFLDAPYNYKVFLKLNAEMIPASFAGRSPLFPALDQANFQLPADAALSCFTRAEIIVQVPGASATETPIPFTLATAAAGQSCPSLLNLNAAALQKLQSGGTVNVGVALVASLDDISASNDPSDEPESVAGAFAFTGNKPAIFGINMLFSVFSAIAGSGFGDPGLLPPAGKCATLDLLDLLQIPSSKFGNLQQVLGSDVSQNINSLSDIYPGATTSPLSAGPQLTLSGPGGSFALTPETTILSITSYSSNDLPAGLFASGGTWTLSAPGDPGGIGPFSTSFAMPAQLEWNNPPANRTVPRDQDLMMQFSGPAGPVTISGASIGSGDTMPTAFVCNANASPFTVPHTILQALPPTSSDQLGTLGLGTGAVINPGTISGLDAAVILTSTGTRSDVTWQ